MIQEVWKCDHADCEEESPPCLSEPPFGWVEVTRFGPEEDTDVQFHFCGWDCALQGVNVALDAAERGERAETEHEAD